MISTVRAFEIVLVAFAAQLNTGNLSTGKAAL